MYMESPPSSNGSNFLVSKLEEIGLSQTRTDPCIFVIEQLIVMIHLGAVLTVGDKHRQESFFDQLSASLSH